jgi:predicted CopG family antitoxin
MHKENAVTKLTTISISRQNYEILRQMGQTGDSFNDVLSMLSKVLLFTQLQVEEQMMKEVRDSKNRLSQGLTRPPTVQHAATTLCKTQVVTRTGVRIVER